MTEVEAIRQLEQDLEARKTAVAKGLAGRREALGLSLRQVGRRVRLSPAGVLGIERGKNWKTSTVARLVRFYDRKQNGQAIRA